jgi:predicted methyltransferase
MNHPLTTLRSILKRGLFPAMTATVLTASAVSALAVDQQRLDEVLSAQPEEVQARYGARHPSETLAFFGVEPGMTVVEALPGGGWYSKILIDYLGPEGELIGADYAVDMFPLFGFFSEEALEAKKTWVQDWSEEANGWVEDGATVTAFQLGSLPESMEGTADAVVMVRALHNLARFEDQGGFLTAAVQDVYDVLKPGGILGVVQHEARPDMPDDFATGSGGYLKKAFIIEQMEAAGFEFIEDSDINQNPKDQPQEGDVVWRLPPTLATTRDDPDGRAAMEAIGESNRMTLKFRKPW